MAGFLQSFSAVVLLFLQSMVLATPTGPATDYNKPPKIGAVASQSSVCSNIGTDLLKRGGTAIDALVGTVLCVGTIGMYDSGIGGGGFMLVRSSNGSYEYVDFRETAPKAAYKDMYQGNLNGSVYSGLARYEPFM